MIHDNLMDWAGNTQKLQKFVSKSRVQSLQKPASSATLKLITLKEDKVLLNKTKIKN